MIKQSRKYLKYLEENYNFIVSNINESLDEQTKHSKLASALKEY